MKGRHGRDSYYIVGEGMRTFAGDGTSLLTQAKSIQEMTEFRFSRFFVDLKGNPNSTNLLAKLAVAMSDTSGKSDSTIPAGYTYLGQFVDHDLTLDKSELNLEFPQSIPGLASARSPTLDLDSLYGLMPHESPKWYVDGIKLRTGRPRSVESPNAAQDGMDLPRWGDEVGGHLGTAREARIPDTRNDENLAIAQLHAAFIRFHNKVVDTLALQGTPSSLLFDKAREIATKHYQWMLIHDYLPRVVDKDIVEDVFNGKRRFFEISENNDATMPVEFSGAAFRLGHSMIRTGYNWNKFFNAKEAEAQGPIRSGHIHRLMRFSGTSGVLFPSSAEPGSDEDLRGLERPAVGEVGDVLPSNWVADFTRLFDLTSFGNEFKAPAGDFNFAMKIDTSIVEPMKRLPLGSFGGTGEPDLALERSLGFRNLIRGRMLALPSGQQLAERMNIKPLSIDELLNGAGGIVLTDDFLSGDKDEMTENTPLWFYILREAETRGGNKLTGVGGTITVETFHRAIEASHNSILADPGFTPFLGGTQGRFDMGDLLHFAFDGRADLLNPHR